MHIFTKAIGNKGMKFSSILLIFVSILIIMIMMLIVWILNMWVSISKLQETCISHVGTTL